MVTTFINSNVCLFSGRLDKLMKTTYAFKDLKLKADKISKELFITHFRSVHISASSLKTLNIKIYKAVFLIVIFIV
jgi:hypothetical protein